MVAANPQKLMGSTKTVKSAGVQPQQQLIAAPADTAALQDISKSLAKITQLLTQQNSQVTAEANQERKNQENAKRNKIELGLENSFAAVKNVAQSVIAPVKNILDSIIQFFVTLFLGKAILNLIDWFSKKENQSKIRSIARFLKDWWPALVAGYILFGTGFGRVVRNLAGVGLSAIGALGSITLKLIGAIASALKFKKAGALLSGLGGGGGFKGLAARLGVGALVAGGGALVASKMMGGGDAPQVSIPEPASLPVAEAFGGGLIDFKTMLAASGGQVDSKLGIFTQLFGSGGLAGLLNSAPGVVSGPKGIDKVPAMLTDGEFVMSRGAVQKFGVSNLEAMNASGGGTNKPKIVQKRIYAEGGGLIGGTEIREKYDAQKGAGAYDKESQRRQAVANATPEKSNLPPVKTNDAYVRQLRERAVKVQRTPLTQPGTSTISPQIDAKGISNRAVSTAKGLFGSVSATTGIGSGKLTPEQQRDIARDTAERNAIIQKAKTKRTSEDQIKKEFNNAFSDPKNPLHEKAAFDDNYNYAQFKKDYLARQAKQVDPTPQKPGYTPYVSPFANARDTAFANAQKIQGSPIVGSNKSEPGRNPYNPMNIFQPGGIIGGPRMSARSDYAASKGKYYSSADQKTYASENDAKAARKSRMTSLASQQGLDKLSRKGANKSSQGVRFDAESKERNKDFEKRGGLTGQIGRGFTRMFGGGAKLDQQDKAATTKVKQAGASSIGRYYSSSDGKYYKDYNAASKARKARLATTPVKGKPITPTPKPKPKVYNPAGGGMGGGRGSGGGSKGTKLPNIPTGKDNSKTAKQLNIK
jgi:hypothetical protein